MRDIKARTKILADDHGFDKNDANKIWGFGPYGEGPNMLFDITQGCQYMHEIKEHMISGFEIVTKQGVLCEENMRGVRFNVVDTYLHQDSIHRGASQIMPATRRVLYAAQLLAQPTLQEPFFLVEINVPNDVVSNVYEVMMPRRGTVEEETQVEGTPLCILRSFLPVSQSFGFTKALREKTNGKAFPNCSFDHWEVMSGNPLIAEDKLGVIILDVRKRKGLKVAIPELNNYLDKL